PAPPDIYTLSLHDALPICHFPDQLLVRKRSVIRSLYRLPLNYLEEFTTGRIYYRYLIYRHILLVMADLTMVNSEFTKQIYYETRSEEHTSELQSRENLVCR